jgi:LysM repeat protein
MSPGSPALAAPKAPRAPAAPSLEEQDQPLDMGVVNQIYRNNKAVIGDNPNIIEPKTMIDLPDGTPYEVQPGDTLSKIARKLPAIKAAAQTQMAQTVAPTDAIAAQPGWFDKVKQAASGIAAGQFPSQAIPAAFPSLKKPAPASAPAPAATTSGTIVYPDWSQTKYANLGPLVKGSDGIWRTQDGKMSAADPEIIAMADKLAMSKAAPATVVKKPPEKVAPADSLDSDEQIVTKSKVKRPKTPYVPTPRPTGKEPPPTATPTGIPAAAEKTGRVVDKVEKSAKQAIDWIGDKIADRAETRGSKSPYTQKNILGSSAYGRYQFMPDTFDGLVKLAKPGDLLYGKTWKDFKKDPKLQDETMRVADAYYTDVLSRNKIPTTDGNKYLSHFVGAENAVGMINNMPETTPLKNIYKDRTSKDGTTIKLKDGTTIPNKFFTKNNFSTDMTVGDLRKWADAKIAPPAKKKTKESTVAETVQTVKVMLETATTRDDVRRIKDYIDRQYTRHGLSDSVSFAQRNHLVERVIEITAKRRILT